MDGRREKVGTEILEKIPLNLFVIIPQSNGTSVVFLSLRANFGMSFAKKHRHTFWNLPASPNWFCSARTLLWIYVGAYQSRTTRGRNSQNQVGSTDFPGPAGNIDELFGRDPGGHKPIAGRRHGSLVWKIRESALKFSVAVVFLRLFKGEILRFVSWNSEKQIGPIQAASDVLSRKSTQQHR